MISWNVFKSLAVLILLVQLFFPYLWVTPTATTPVYADDPACPEATADIWFGMDESWSVSNDEFDDWLDFMYQVSDAFFYDATTGMQWWAYARRTVTVDNVIPVSEDFWDPGDSWLIQNGNVVIDNDGNWIRELYPSRQWAWWTNLTLATQHMADLISAWNGRRASTPQVAVIITDASESQLINNTSWWWTNWVTAADNYCYCTYRRGCNII